MIVSISYADGRYKKFQNYNSLSAKWFGKINKVLNYGPEDIEESFRETNKDIFSIVRGNGLWLWKPHLIDITLNQLNDGDYLVYSDAAIVFMKDIRGLVEKLHDSSQDVMLFDLPFIEVEWTHPYIFEKLGADCEKIKLTNQRNGAIIILKKTNNSVAFVKEWLQKCCDIDLLRGNIIDKELNKLYITHREDQSILSVLSKQRDIKSFSDPTDYGGNPFSYLAYNSFFRINKKDELFDVHNTYFLHHRGYNIIIYYLKYKVRSFVKMLFFQIK